MRQSVLNLTACLRQTGTTRNAKRELVKKIFFTFSALMTAFFAMAQTTYTTKADGNWSSASTWAGGIVPGASVAAGTIINIKHDVKYDVNSDLTLAGTLNITNDTLRFAAAFNKNIAIQSTGVLNVTNGGFLQDVTADKSNLQITGGKLFANKALITISKELNVSAGAKQSYKSSTVMICGKYTIDGTSASPCIDTIQSSTVQVSVTKNGDFEVKNYTTLRVANAKVMVGNGKFKTDANASVSVLASAANNYGFDLVKTANDLENAGTWDARIDAFCVGKNVSGAKATDIDFTRPEDCSATSTTTKAPEMSFVAPVLKSGKDKQAGAVYRYSNVMAGVDAEIKLKKFSRNDIVVNSFDNSSAGWNKAFQPEFGLSGNVAANQDWYIDFEMTFYSAGTNKKIKVQRADFTALDVDGDGSTVSEYVAFNNPVSIAYSPFSKLTTVPATSLGTTAYCSICKVSSVLTQCLTCHGTGEDLLGATCVLCSGTGVLFGNCSHSYDGIVGDVLQGPVQNFGSIDTAGTAAMATFQYVNVDHVSFRYGAKTGSRSASGSAIRLNSIWSKSFNLAPALTTLPVNFSRFSVVYTKGDAVLNWQAEQVEAVNYFVVQRSVNGKDFEDIATVFEGTPVSYSYTDKAISSASGLVYYRIKAVANTKEIRLTDVKIVRLANAETSLLTLTVFPNPASAEARVILPANWQNKAVMLQLMTASGNVVKAVQLSNASQTETLDLTLLPKGMYMVKAVCGAETAMQRVIKN